MMTSNRPLEDWGKLLGDVPTATAILDRSLRHAEVVAMNGRSYRLRDRPGAAPPEESNPADAPLGPERGRSGSNPAQAPTGSGNGPADPNPAQAPTGSDSLPGQAD
jgi:hypothetical protein